MAEKFTGILLSAVLWERVQLNAFFERVRNFLERNWERVAFLLLELRTWTRTESLELELERELNDFQ